MEIEVESERDRVGGREKGRARESREREREGDSGRERGRCRETASDRWRSDGKRERGREEGGWREREVGMRVGGEKGIESALIEERSI